MVDSDRSEWPNIILFKSLLLSQMLSKSFQLLGYTYTRVYSFVFNPILLFCANEKLEKKNISALPENNFWKQHWGIFFNKKTKLPLFPSNIKMIFCDPTEISWFMAYLNVCRDLKSVMPFITQQSSCSRKITIPTAQIFIRFILLTNHIVVGELKTALENV